MSDCFALLGQDRRPWLEEESLKDRFHRLTSEHHPDVSTGTEVDFSGIIAAYNLLRAPKTRLRHLLELEFPDHLPDSRQVPGDLLDLFMNIAAALSAFNKIVQKLETTTSPLAVALLAGEKNQVCSGLKELRDILRQKEVAALEELRLLDTQWPTNKAATREPLSRILQQLSFLGKWSDQIREALLRLS